MSDYNYNNNNENNPGVYNDDLYMDVQDVEYAQIGGHAAQEPVYPRHAQPVRKSFGKKLLSGLLVCGLMVGSSALSVAGYAWWSGQNRTQTQQPAIQGGQQIVYTLQAGEGTMTPQEIFVKSSPSVVSITSHITVANPYPFFGGGSSTSTSTGTGIIMREDGYIITNHHVIDGATKITVTTKQGEYDAVLVGSEAKTDMAVLKIDAKGLQAAEFGQSAELVTGDAAIVIGNPLGQEFADTMTIGYVSAPERVVQISDYIMSLIQVDAAVNPGNSGGPLINSRGQVVGVVNAKIATENVEGIGFAIPIDKALTIANDLIEYGYVASRPSLGIIVQSISREQAQYYGYEPGITVTEVTPGSCADKGGIKVGDKILAFNGVAVSDADELNFQKEKYASGDSVTITVEREGQQLDLTVVLTSGTPA